MTNVKNIRDDIMDKESILKAVHSGLTKRTYSLIWYMYCGIEGSQYGDAIIERVYDYARLQCIDATEFFNIKKLLSDLDCPIDENWVDVLFYRAVMEKNFKKIRFLHAYGANIHAWNDVAVRLAFELGDYELARELIYMGADVCANNGQALKAATKTKNADMLALIAESLMHKEAVRNFLHNAPVKDYSN